MRVISVQAGGSLKDDVFLHEIWNQFYDGLKEGKDMVLDLTNISFVQSIVVPKLCCLGMIAKKNGINVHFLPSDKVAKYLAEFDFWNIIAKYNIFIFDERLLEIKSEGKKVTNAFFCIEKNMLGRKYAGRFEFKEGVSESTKYKYYVKAELVGEWNIGDKSEYSYRSMPSQCQAVLKTMSNFISYSKYTSEDKIIDSLVELVHNSVWHSEGVCFVMVQACTYKDVKGIEISVADTGKGLYKSLVDKEDFFPKCYKKEDFCKISDLLKQNYCSIIEALLYRKESVVRGIYNILDDLARTSDEVNSEVRIVNGNISLNLQKDNIKKLINGSLKDVLSEQKEYMTRKNDIGYAFSINMCMYQERKEG